MPLTAASSASSASAPHDDGLARSGRPSLDTWLDAAYRRHGTRGLLGGYVVFSWIAGLGAGAVGLLGFARLERWSADTVLELSGLVLLVWATGLGAALAGSLRLARPFSALRDAPELDALIEAREAALRWPAVASRWSTSVAVVWILPVAVVSLIVVASADALGVAIFILFAGTAFVIARVGGMFGAQVVVRPIVRDLSARHDMAPSSYTGPSVRMKLLVAVPGFTVAMAGGGVLVGAAPGADHGTLATGILIAAGAAALFAIPITLLLAYSLLQPLDELLAGTERLKLGAFDTPVPELSADEYGRLARSFNEAMEGLAERQHLAADNERLLDEIRRLLDEVRASRARIVAASDAERRRVERNIHDGAQQRLVAVALDLRMLTDLAATHGIDALVNLADGARANLTEALEELRELARGLHPSVLTSDGLRPALTQLASLAPIPVAVDVPRERFDESVESIAYFVACEALANVAKYASASHADVSIARENGCLVIEISDDGIGGATPSDGSGLAGLADRVEAIGGALKVDSQPSRGTTITAELPLNTETT